MILWNYFTMPQDNFEPTRNRETGLRIARSTPSLLANYWAIHAEKQCGRDVYMSTSVLVIYYFQLGLTQFRNESKSAYYKVKGRSLIWTLFTESIYCLQAPAFVTVRDSMIFWHEMCTASTICIFFALLLTRSAYFKQNYKLFKSSFNGTSGMNSKILRKSK